MGAAILLAAKVLVGAVAPLRTPIIALATIRLPGLFSPVTILGKHMLQLRLIIAAFRVHLQEEKLHGEGWSPQAEARHHTCCEDMTASLLATIAHVTQHMAD